MELAFRYAQQTLPTENRTLVQQEEFATAVNYFFAGHSNKLTIEYALIAYEEDTQNPDETINRFRLQWDISF